MINPNLNSNIPANLANDVKKDLYLTLTDSEKEELISSLQFLGTDFEKFVISFYKGFLAEKTLKFIQSNNKESLINMLTASLNLVISSIEQPIPLEEYVNILISRTPTFPELMRNKDLFTKAFMKALVDTFNGNYTDRLGSLWFRCVSNFCDSVSVLLNKQK